MSSLLKEAIVDAKALREAALKSAETTIVEKYSDEVKKNLDRILEQDELGLGPMGDMGAPVSAPDADIDVPLGAAEGEELCPCPDEGEETEVEINFDELAEALRTLNEESSKPDFLDLDKDNNKTESMKSAAASAKKMMKGGRVKKMGGGMSKLNPGLRKFMMAKKKAK